MELKKGTETNDLNIYDRERIGESKDLERAGLPPLVIMRKSINITPRRRIITLKLPKVELTTRDSNILSFPKTSTEKNENNRYLSMSVECNKSPSPDVFNDFPVKSKLNQYQLSIEDPYHSQQKYQRMSVWKIKTNEKVKLQKLSYKSRSVWRDLSKKPRTDNQFAVKGESKIVQSPIPVLNIAENSLLYEIKRFKDNVDTKFKKLYEEIDINRNGFIILDDIINIVILLGLIKQDDIEHSYLSIKNKAIEIYQAFILVSAKNKVPRKEFFAVCSVQEHNNPSSAISEFFLLENILRIKTQINELKQVFNCYSKNGIIDPREMKSILSCVKADDILQIESFVCTEPIDFARFLRFLPLFLWMHQEVVRQLDINH